MNIRRLRTFVEEVTEIVGRQSEECGILNEIRPRLASLIAKDDWLPEQFAVPGASFFQQYLLHCDPQRRFSIISFVCGVGQKTPVHDHTVWGLIGALRGAEITTQYHWTADGGGLTKGATSRLEPGDIEIVSPTLGDIHEVGNALPHCPSISIHVYGANIGVVTRHAYDVDTGASKDFVSGFSSNVVPNIWS